MPTISVDKAALFQALGREYVQFPFQPHILRTLTDSLCLRYTTEEFDELCFEFGMSHRRCRRGLR
jgi:CRP-like cAMP-binding protein